MSELEVGEGDGHFLIVEGWDGDDLMWHVEHTPDCKKVTRTVNYNFQVFVYDEWECAIQYQIDQAGEDAFYPTKIPKNPGKYPLSFWSEVYRGFDWTEYDAGITVWASIGEP